MRSALAQPQGARFSACHSPRYPSANAWCLSWSPFGAPRPEDRSFRPPSSMSDKTSEAGQIPSRHRGFTSHFRARALTFLRVDFLLVLGTEVFHVTRVSPHVLGNERV